MGRWLRRPGFTADCPIVGYTYGAKWAGNEGVSGFFDRVGPPGLEGADRVRGRNQVVDPHGEAKPCGVKEAACRSQVRLGAEADLEARVEGSDRGTGASVVDVGKEGFHVGAEKCLLYPPAQIVMAAPNQGRQMGLHVRGRWMARVKATVRAGLSGEVIQVILEEERCEVFGRGEPRP